MKKIYLIIAIISSAIQLKAQLEYDDRGNVIPFSQAENYKDKIDINDINTYEIPYLNNDSLFRAHNNGKSIDELKMDYVHGFVYDNVPFSIKTKGTKIDLGHGALWIYKINSVSAGSLTVNIKCPTLYKGNYLAFIATDTSINLIQPPRLYQADDLLDRHKKRGLSEIANGKSLVIEYYEPHSLQKGEDIFINRIIYKFVDFGNRISNLENTGQLKSGGWGSSANSECQYDVSCAEVSGWKNEASSVVYIKMEYAIDRNLDGLVEYYRRNGTGVFLNKVGDYADTENPLVLTAGHLYSSTLADGNTVDIVNSFETFEVYTAYENSECNEVDINRGLQLPGDFSRIYLGSDFNVLPSESSYSACMDYAILEATAKAEDLSYYDVEFAGWSTNYNLHNSSNTGYTCIHHPGGDVKKINKDNHKAYDVFSGDFNLYFDVGVSESGTSGAPIFNNARQVVGWAAGASNLAGCEYVGQVTSRNKTVCGSFDVAYLDFYSRLDPAFIGEATSSNPSPPLPSELPSHCRNCIRDGDETGVDCGGSCYPCGMQDVLTIKTSLDLLGNVKSRYEIFAEPDPGNLLALKSGDSYLEAGMNIYMNGGFEVQRGATFYAGIDAELMTEAERGCQPACVNLANVFTPNGDGKNDYWVFGQAFITSYDLIIWDRYDHVMYSADHIPVYENGAVFAWDGAGAVSGAVYWGILTYRDCYGNSHNQDFFTHVFKSAAIDAIDPVNSAIKQNIDVKTVEIEHEIKVFPNPFTEKVTITFSGKDFPLSVKIIDLNGKDIISKETYNANKELDLSGLAPGVYIINAKAGEYNLVQKLIKK